MGNIWLHKTRFADYCKKWGLRADFASDYEKRSRSSGGYDSMMGMVCHHAASNKNSTLSGALHWATVSSPVKPVGSGTVSRKKDGPKILIWASGATNTAGKGGARLTTRGVIPKDAANRVTFNIEAENNGTDEGWAEEVCDIYVLLACVWMDWATHETPGAPVQVGDIMAHFEWAPGRKIDPAGASRFNGYVKGAKWNMDLFRAEVYQRYLRGPSNTKPEPTPTPTPTPTETGTYTVVSGDGWYAIARKVGFPLNDILKLNGATINTPLHPGQVLKVPASVKPTPPPNVTGLEAEFKTLSPGQLPPAMSWTLDQYPTYTRWLQVVFWKFGWFAGPVNGMWTDAWQDRIKFVQGEFKLKDRSGVWTQESIDAIGKWWKEQAKPEPAPPVVTEQTRLEDEFRTLSRGSLPGAMPWPTSVYPEWTRWLQVVFWKFGWYSGPVNGNWTREFQDRVAFVQKEFGCRQRDGVWTAEIRDKVHSWWQHRDQNRLYQ